MTVINLLNQPAAGKSVDQNSAQLINMYLTEDSDQGKYPLYATFTPGLTVFATINSPVRAIYVMHNITYAVGGNTLYSIASDGTPTILGTLNTSTGFAKIRGILNQIMVIDGTNGYVWDIPTVTFSQISDVNFNNTSTDLDSQDEFFLTAKPNTQTWQQSSVSDGTNWTFSGLGMFTNVTGNNNYLLGLKSFQRQIWLFGSDTISIYYNGATTGFTWKLNDSVYVEMGCAAKNAITYADNTLVFLGKNRNGGKIVIRMNGYTPEVISTRAVNYQISTYSTVDDATAFAYWQEGHEFYVLTFPTAGVTWVYDFSTKIWHQRQSLISGNQTRWLPNCHGFCYNKNLVGDYNSGNIYSLDMTNYQENGVAITRTLITHPFYNAGAWIYCSKLQIDFDESTPLSANTFNLSVSHDGGYTFGAAKAGSLAGAGNTISGPRMQWQRLGASKNFVFKLTTSMNAPFMILGAWANITMGLS